MNNSPETIILLARTFSTAAYQAVDHLHDKFHEPYYFHTRATADKLAEYTTDHSAIAAAHLLNITIHTNVSIEDIFEVFDNKIADYVCDFTTISQTPEEANVPPVIQSTFACSILDDLSNLPSIDSGFNRYYPDLDVKIIPRLLANAHPTLLAEVTKQLVNQNNS